MKFHPFTLLTTLLVGSGCQSEQTGEIARFEQALNFQRSNCAAENRLDMEAAASPLGVELAEQRDGGAPTSTSEDSGSGTELSNTNETATAEPSLPTEDIPETIVLAGDLPALEALGKHVFFDNISEPAVQSCASCHAAASGWTGGDSVIHLGPVAVPGAVSGRSGNRRPPTIAYAGFTPVFGDAGDAGSCLAEDALGVQCMGGLFLDGRATGARIGQEIFGGDAELTGAYERYLGPLADQALDPFSNDVEQNVPDGLGDCGLPGAEFVCQHVRDAPYVEWYVRAWGTEPNCEQRADLVFKRVAFAIAAFERSAEVSPFSSKRDYALAMDDDDTPGAFPLAGLTDEENLGHDLFYGLESELNPAGKNAGCALCHNSEGPGSQGDEPEQLYTDHRYHHLGVPPNFELPGFADAPADLGLANHTGSDRTGHIGHFRTPTLRNVGKVPDEGFTKSYMHNGYFKTLEDVVHFYNTATLKLDPEACPPGTTAAQARERDCWPAPEFSTGTTSSAFGLFGDLGLSNGEEAALVAYMRALSDDGVVEAPEDLVADLKAATEADDAVNPHGTADEQPWQSASAAETATHNHP